MDRGLRIYVYWVTTALTALLFAVPGTLLLARQPHFGSEMARLGYPPYLLAILGSLKILGVLVVLAPRLKRLKECLRRHGIGCGGCGVLARSRGG